MTETLNAQALNLHQLDTAELDANELDQIAAAGIWGWIAVRLAAKAIIYVGDKVYDGAEGLAQLRLRPPRHIGRGASSLGGPLSEPRKAGPATARRTGLSLP